MRLVCLSLVLVNFALLAYFVSRPDAAQDKPISERIRSDLLLLSELPSVPLVAAVTDETPVGVVSVSSEPAPAASPAVPMCSMIGPFDKVFRANRLLGALKSLGLKPQVYTETIKVETGYWVILPPAASRKRAREILTELTAKKIDSFIIREGELDNAISLGVYSRRERAQVMVEQMSRQGYSVDISPIVKDSQQYWAVLLPEDAQKASKEQLELLQFSSDSIKKRQKPCEGLALSSNIQ